MITRLVTLHFCEHCHRQKQLPGPSWCAWCRTSTINHTFNREIKDLPNYLTVRFHSPRPPSTSEGGHTLELPF